MAIRDHLNGLWDDEDFEEWYPRDGKPGLSPAQLATVSVLQFLLELSDRQAAESVRNRIDFKYAMGMDLEDPGFHHSVLADFRERLTEEGRADKLLDLALEKIRAVGLVRERGRQRTDSTHVLAAVRDLTRLELVTQAMRATLEELARRAPHELVGLVTEDWGKRYGRAARLGKNPSKPKTRIKETGEDVRLLLHVHRYLPTLRGGEQVQALRQIFVQNYFIDTQDRPKWRETEGAGLRPFSRRHRLALRSERPLRAPRRDPMEGLPGARHRNLRSRRSERDHRRDHHQGRRPRHQGPSWHHGQPQSPEPALEGTLRRRRLPLRRTETAGRPRTRRRPGRTDPSQEHPPVPQGHRLPPRSLHDQLGREGGHLPAGQRQPPVVDTAVSRPTSMSSSPRTTAASAR
ncbi:transposase [Streptomyces sp. NPDC001520]|uniref:transposase n=1 Tax=Streptomyces sp. NPDC001520 TaxID=3364581 RepID=UPI0036975885